MSLYSEVVKGGGSPPSPSTTARFLEWTFKGLKKFSGEPEDKDKYKDKDTFIGYYIEYTTRGGTKS